MTGNFDEGWYSLAQKRPSSHYDNRPDEAGITAIIIHCISLPCGCYGLQYIDDLFMGCIDCNAHPDFHDLENIKVSSHFFINRQGEVMQYVSVLNRAWHAGESCLNGRENVNDFSVGIELEGTDKDTYTEEQYNSLTKLVSDLMARWSLEVDNIVGHEHIAPGRKTDPGPGFDWAFFRQHLTLAGS